MKKLMILVILLAFAMFSTAGYADAPTVTKDFEKSIAENKLSGYTTFHQYCTVDADTTERVATNNFQTTYPFRDSAGTFEIVSSSALDIGSVEVKYLDSNWDLQTVYQDLNGQTPVESDVSAIRFISASLVYNGTQEVNAGDIYIFYDSTVTAGVPDTLTNVFLKIDADEGISKSAVFSVPRNYRAIIVNMFMNGAVDGLSESITGSSYMRVLIPLSGQYIEYKSDSVTVGIFPDISFDGPKGLAEKTDFYLTCSSSDASSPIRIGFTIYLRPE